MMGFVEGRKQGEPGKIPSSKAMTNYKLRTYDAESGIGWNSGFSIGKRYKKDFWYVYK